MTLHGCFEFAILAVGDDGQASLLTEEAAQILGIDANQASLPLLDQFPTPLKEVVFEVRKWGRPIKKRQVEFARRGGENSQLSVSAFRLATEQDRKSVVLALSDLTPAKRVVDKLGQLGRLADLGTLSASMAHEIRNALVAGKTFIDLLLEKHQDSELADVVRRELSRIDAIVSGMLKFSGAAKTTFQKINLHEILEHSLRLVRPQLESRAVGLERSFEAVPDLMEGNDYELQQAFVNLFLNAFEAMSSSGTVTVLTDLIPAAGSIEEVLKDAGTPRRIRVRIKDTGAGISPENQKRLFEPFFTTKTNGTGLGLAITRRIVQEHGGEISVQSAVEQGTTFSILFPAVPVDKNPRAERPAVRRQKSGQKQ
jgi:signal transduction histidine kinase